MSGGDGVEVLTRGENFVGPLGLIPAATKYPFAGLRGLRLLGDARFHFFKRLGSGEFDLQLSDAAGCKVQVGIVESGHNELAAEVDDLGVLAGEFLHVSVGADGGNVAFADGE